MGKVVILGGNARSGKSTLAFGLVRHGFSRISLDNIQKYLEDGLKIDFDNLSKEQKLNFFKSIIDTALQESQNEETNIVIDMCDFLPEDLENIGIKDKKNIYYLIYPNCTKEQIKYNVVHYAKKTDWIAQVNQEYLNECVDRFYKQNQIILGQCVKYNYKYIDTSAGAARNTILEELLHEIIS